MESQVAKFFIERETRAKLWNLGLLFWQDCLSENPQLYHGLQ